MKMSHASAVDDEAPIFYCHSLRDSRTINENSKEKYDAIVVYRAQHTLRFSAGATAAQKSDQSHQEA